MMSPWRNLCTRTTATKEPTCKESRQGMLLLRVSAWVLSTSVYTTKRNIFLKNFCSWTELHVYVTIIQWCRSLWLTLFYCSYDCESIYFFFYHFLPIMISFGKTWGRGLEEIVVIFYSEENSALHLKKKKVTFRFIRYSMLWNISISFTCTCTLSQSGRLFILLCNVCKSFLTHLFQLELSCSWLYARLHMYYI